MPTSPQPAHIEEDEIDLFELWLNLVEEKVTIITTFFITVIIAGLYAFLSTPTYQAKSYLLPPSENLISPLNALNLATNRLEKTYTRESVFNLFKQNLESRTLLRKVFNQNDLYTVYGTKVSTTASKAQKRQAYQNAFEKFLKSYEVSFQDKKKNILNGINVSLELPSSPTLTIKVLNDIISLARETSINELYTAISTRKKILLKHYQSLIDSARKIALNKRLDKIQAIDEALQITTSLNQHKPILKQNMQVFLKKGLSNEIALYLLGSDLLTSQKSVLENRKSDDAFIPQLRDWQAKIGLIQSVDIDKNQFDVVKMDTLESFSEKVKPKKALILAVAGVLGLMLGIFIALIRHAIKSRKRKTEEETITKSTT